MRHRWLLLAALIVAPPAAGCREKSCDADGLDKIRAALSNVRGARGAEMTASALVDVCGSGELALPGPLKSALEGVYQAPPDMRPVMTLRVAAEAPALWLEVCPAGPRALAEMGALPREQHVAHLVDKCNLPGDAGLATKEELLKTPADLVVLGTIVHRWLLKGNNDESASRAVARGLMAL
jgi:hypothetical protein